METELLQELLQSPHSPSDSAARGLDEQQYRMLELLYGPRGTDRRWGPQWGQRWEQGLGEGEGHQGEVLQGEGQQQEGLQGQVWPGAGPQGQVHQRGNEEGQNWLLEHMRERRVGRGRTPSITLRSGSASANLSSSTDLDLVDSPRPIDALVHALLLWRLLRQHGATLRHVALDTEVSVLLGPMPVPLLVSQHGTILCSSLQYGVVQYSTTIHGTAQHNTDKAEYASVEY